MIKSYIPRLTYKEENCDNGFLVKLSTSEEDMCTKLSTCIFGTWRTYKFNGYKFIKPRKFVSKSDNRKGELDYADVSYGFSFYKEGNKHLGLFLYYGVRENTLYNEIKQQMIIWNYPWKESSFKYHRYLNLDGSIGKSGTENYKSAIEWRKEFKWREECQEFVKYNVVDKYDGKKIIATVKLEERCWTKGSRSFKWLRFITKPIISRTLDVSFNKEIGKKKGSWKGGIVGTGIELEPNESIDRAFSRLCKKYDLLIGTQGDVNENK